MLTNKLTGAGAADKTYIEDVFSTYLYTGNGSTQTINNGIDLAGKGGLVWTKNRQYSGSTRENSLFDTNRGVNLRLKSDSTDPQASFSYSVSSFNSNGFDVTGYTSENYASWTFRKAPKFFDVVTYTGNGVDGRIVTHNLDSMPGMIIIKRTSTGGTNWVVWHRSIPDANSLFLNTTDSIVADDYFSGQITSTQVPLAHWAEVNGSGSNYVMYLFAHDTSTDGLIQCGSFTPDGSGNATVNLGWEPQYLLIKRTDSPSSGNWVVLDTMRGFNLSTSYALNPNTTAAEYLFGVGSQIIPTATGFSVSGGLLSAGSPYIYMAIRRGPMRTPTDGTKVFKAVLQTNDFPSASANVGFATDMSITSYRTVSGGDRVLVDRLRGVPSTTTSGVSELLLSHTTAAAITWNASDGYGWWYPNTTDVGTFGVFGTNDAVIWNFKRAPGFFDVVCYTGTGSARTVNHNLGVAPELMIVKCRSNTRAWCVYNKDIPATTALSLNTTQIPTENGTLYWNSTRPTSTVFSLGNALDTNGSGYTYVAYLFASCPGVSKVGSYTGTGSTQTISCGFTGGARFVLIKRTDSAGDWYVWDTARGMVAGTDPSLLLNTTAAEVNANSIYTTTGGFQIVSTAAGINDSGGTYIYLAIA